MPTPKDVRYATPINVSPRSAKTLYFPGSDPNRWTPAPLLRALHSQPGPVMLGGLTRLDIATKHQEGHNIDEDEEWDEAEAKFREALAGCQVLLSTAHEITRKFTYHLAEFYVQHDRMMDADVLLDWMTDKLSSQICSEETLICHLLEVAKMLRCWSRLEEAKTFGKLLVELVSATHVERKSTATELMQTIPHIKTSPSSPTGKTSNQGLQHYVMSLSTMNVTCTSRTDYGNLMDSQLSLALAYVEANDQAVEDYLLTIIDQCSRHPAHLTAQTLKAWTAIIELYQRLGRLGEMDRALLQARDVLFNISKSEYRTTKSLSKVALETAKFYIEVGKDDIAADIFTRIEGNIADAFSDDLGRTKDLLIGIGVWFQHLKRWRDARCRFERALALALAEHGFCCELVKRLESTLEHRRYTHPERGPCECFDLSDGYYGSCTTWTSKASTGETIEAKECHLALVET